MANTKSAKKAARQAPPAATESQQEPHHARLRSTVRKVEEAIASGDQAAAEARSRRPRRN